MSITIEKPAPLDQDRFYTRAERHAHSKQLAAYETSLRETEKPSVKAEPEPYQPSVSYLSESEYDALRRTEWEADMARRKARDDEQAAKAKAHAEYLASEPEVVDVRANDPHTLMSEIVQWANRGYQMFDGGALWFTNSFYHVQLQKPAPAPARKR